MLQSREKGIQGMGETEDRARRKHEHIAAVKSLPDVGGTGFADVRLLPRSAPEIDVDQVSLGTELLGRHLASPIIINAMTGGTEESGRINATLAAFAKRHGLAMAVGSETAALQSADASASYTVVREINPDGVVIANLGMGVDIERSLRAVELVGADFLQIHWNAAQEMFMAEGDRRFRGFLERLSGLQKATPVPIIAKEVGQGMTGPSARQFIDAGANAVDIGGLGGTNFIAVEAWRRHQPLEEEWLRWGVPTAASLGEVAAELQGKSPIVASGGIRTGHDVVKALVMGATAVGIAGPLLRLAAEPDGDQRLDQWLAEIHETMRMLHVLMGAATISEVGDQPAIVGGSTGDWLELRGYGEYRRKLARRGR